MTYRRAFHWFSTILTAAVFVFTCTFGAYMVHAESPAQRSFYCGFTILGRSGCQGYLTNTDFYVYDASKPEVTANNVIIYNATNRFQDALPATSINSSASLVALYETYLSRGSPTNYDYDSFGAAATVDAMLGVSGPDLCLWYTSNASTTCTWQAAVAYAQDPTHLADWVSRVNYYASNGWINWNLTMFLPAGYPNSGHACTTDTPQCTAGVTPPISPSVDARDIVWKGVGATDLGLTQLISFDNPDGSHFMLERYCGNFVGQTSGLITPPPSSPPTCAAMTTSLPYIDPHESFTITASVSFPSSADATAAVRAGYKIAVAVTGPNGYAYNSGKLSPSATGNVLTARTPSIGPVGTGAYTVSYNIYNVSGTALISPACRGVYTVADMPYFTVQGGDVSAGAGMATEAPDGSSVCTPADPKAGIVSWNQEASGNYAGAGTQYAAYALNYLQDFATAQGGGSSSAPSGLAFANSTNVSGDNLFGGGFGAEPCLPDYFAGATNIQTGNITIGGQSVANGTHTTVYVKGNVYITGNVAYSDSYADFTDIPSYAVVVEGNIYIDPGVSRLDGLYVAEPASDGTGGVIYTCATGFSAPALDSGLYDTCNDNSLTVNGSFVANQVRLLRTTGTVGQSGSAAETFNFNPEIWMSAPPTDADGNSYDAITSLPPVL